MSFDVYLFRFLGGAPTTASPDGARRALQSLETARPREDGVYRVETPDGGLAEVGLTGIDGTEPFEGVTFFIRGFSPRLAEFMFQVAQSSDMVILPTSCEPLCILTAEAQEQELPPDVTEGLRLVLCRSAEELGALLTGGFGQWAAYRDQVLRG